MEREVIAALAKGLVPFVQQAVTEAVAPFAVRMAELEARPTEKGDAGPPGQQGPPGPPGDSGELAMVPPELAEQIKSAIHLLHESPPIVKCDEPPRWPTPPRVTRIERDADGNFVPVYEPALAKAGETQP
jgi:hypothetical protein